MNQMKQISDIMAVKKANAEKSKANYHKKKLDGTNKKIVKPEDKKKRGRPKLIKASTLESSKKVVPRGRPIKIIHIDDLPQYLTKKTNPNNPY